MVVFNPGSDGLGTFSGGSTGRLPASGGGFNFGNLLGGLGGA
jgi:hypothetical protein